MWKCLTLQCGFDVIYVSTEVLKCQPDRSMNLRQEKKNCLVRRAQNTIIPFHCRLLGTLSLLYTNYWTSLLPIMLFESKKI